MLEFRYNERGIFGKGCEKGKGREFRREEKLACGRFSVGMLHNKANVRKNKTREKGFKCGNKGEGK